MNHNEKKITIALVGRQNVGKSTLFNRLLGYKKSVVSDISHTTRDSVYGITKWNDVEYEIIDTGGIEVKTQKNSIIDKIKIQARISIFESDIIFYVIDNNIGIQKEDLIIYKMIYKSKKPLVLVINKVDDIKKINYDVEKFPAKTKLYVSAIHGKNVYQLFEQCEKIQIIKQANASKNIEPFFSFSFVGLTNAGKSSLFNLLIKKNKNIVSWEENTTRDSLNYFFKHSEHILEIIDTPGLRIQNITKDELLYYSYLRSFQTIKNSDIVLFIIDVSKKLSKQIKKIFFYIVQLQKPCIILLNKVDLVSKSHVVNYIKLFNSDIPVSINYIFLPISVLNNKNIEIIFEKMFFIKQKLNMIISTSKINKFIVEFQSNHFVNDSKISLKIYYGTSVNVRNKIIFTFFINSKKLIKKNYLIFFKKQLITTFDLKYIPIDIKFKER